MNWKCVESQLSFKKFRRDFFALKVINTQYLITEPSNSFIFNKKIKLNVHYLITAKEIVGYEVILQHDFPLILVSKDNLLLGFPSLKQCSFKCVYKDKHLDVFKTRNHDFLFAIRNSL